MCATLQTFWRSHQVSSLGDPHYSLIKPAIVWIFFSAYGGLCSPAESPWTPFPVKITWYSFLSSVAPPRVEEGDGGDFSSSEIRHFSCFTKRPFVRTLAWRRPLLSRDCVDWVKRALTSCRRRWKELRPSEVIQRHTNHCCTRAGGNHYRR
jgi:hypothetical protein